MIKALSLVASLFAGSSQALQYAPSTSMSSGTSTYTGYSAYGTTQSNGYSGYSAYANDYSSTHYGSASHTSGAWDEEEHHTTSDSYYQSPSSGQSGSTSTSQSSTDTVSLSSEEPSTSSTSTITTGIRPSARDQPEWGFEIRATFYDFDSYHNTIVTDTHGAFKLYALGPQHQSGENEGRLKLWILNDVGTYNIQGNLEFDDGHVGDGTLVTEPLETYKEYIIRVEKHPKYMAMAVNGEWYLQVNYNWASTTMETPGTVQFKQTMQGTVSDWKYITESKCSLFAANEAINN